MFHPAVTTWFQRRFPDGPTQAQQDGWAAIAAGRDTLIAAPTGSGKTLAAFLVCIDRLLRAPRPEPHDGGEAGIEVVYVSPLKALAVDIHHNLETPLAEIRESAAELGLPLPEIRVALRTADTPAHQRSALWKNPPQIVVTTPESLYLLLTAQRSREALRGARTVIVDEIHALARDKRGSHLALTLERLEHVARQRPVRIGLSATQRPIERIAELLTGVAAKRARPECQEPACAIVDSGHRRALELEIELPDSELEAVASSEQMAQVLDKIAQHARARRTTLVFVNTRRLSERLAHQLSERLGADLVAAHHGSLAKSRRETIEGRLRSGELRVVVATASLELGIDIGPVELVCQVGSPRNIATLLQRVGRSGHNRYATPVGRLYPLTRDELVECAALLRSVRAGELDAIVVPHAPMDVLAQQIVAECAAEDWQEDGLYELFRRAYPYRELSRAQYDEVVTLVSDGIMTGRGRRAAYLHRDRVGNRLSGRRGARLSALTSGGAIPESADYRVIAEPNDTPVGTVNEDFAIESMAGDVFLLGSTSWRIRRVTPGVVRVVDAEGATPTVPFWLGEAPARSAELSSAVSELRSELDRQLGAAGEVAAAEWLARDAGLSATAAREVVAYLGATRAALGLIPSQRDLTFERFFDETGGMQLVVHAPFGARINRALGLLLRKRFCTSFDFELQAAASDDAIVLSLGPQHSFPLDDMLGFLRPARVRESLITALIVTPMFAVRWRWNLNRALTVLRWRGGKKNPPPLQRMEADDVMVAVFPALAACQDNATGPREIPDHVLVRQTLDDCLHEAMDLAALELLLERIQNAELRLHFKDTTEPSPLAHEILNSRPYTFLDDAPLEERRTRAVQLRRGLPASARDLAALDPEAVAKVRAEVRPAPRDPSELHDLLLSLLVMRPDTSLQEFFAPLQAQGRALLLATASGPLWAARELQREATLLFPEATFDPDLPLPAAVMAQPALELEAALDAAVRGYLDCAGPTTLAQLALGTGLDAEALPAPLARLEGQGFALRGQFDPHESAEQFCARRLLGRIHAYTQRRLRREIEPVSAQDYMRFLLRHHRLEPGQRREGSAGVMAAIEQLQGYELAAMAWESEVLPARVESYRPEWLDGLCLSGQVCWGRGSLRSAASDEARNAQTSRVTPVTLALRSDLSWLLAAARAEANGGGLGPDTARVIACLESSGALFFSQLCAQTGLGEAQVREALWDGVARGLLSADGWSALRGLIAPRAPADSYRAALLRGSSLRRGLRGSTSAEGRWSLLMAAGEVHDRDALCEAVAEQLVARWGVVFYELVACESLALPWREIVWALRRLEARGQLRGGRFVAGFAGEQYALPEAIEQLRAVRREAKRETRIRISACDPLNLTGVLFKSGRVPALRTNYVTYCDGAPEDVAALSAQLA
jgi:ATP-dependent helicase Lhr and Lhr-like helicase